MVAFVSSLISAIRTDFPNFGWWVIAYNFCCIVGVAVVVASDSAQTYHVAVCQDFHNEGSRLTLDRLLGFWVLGWSFAAR